MKLKGPLGLALSVGLLSSSAVAQTPSPIGLEFQVNTYTTSGQYYPSVSVDADGDFVVVWHSSGSSGTDTSGYSVQGQRFAADGTPQGGEFQVNTYTTNGQMRPSVAVEADGDLVVVWHSSGSSGTDTSGESIQGQRYDAAGMAVGGQFQVNTYTTNNQRISSVAVGGDGDFVVVWQSPGSSGTDTSGYSVQGQRFAADGTPQGGEFQVNTYTTSNQYGSEVAVGGDGDFVVVWEGSGSSGTDTSSLSVHGQRFAADGTPQGGEFQVNTYTTGQQIYSSVSVDADGDFVVVWKSDGSNGTDTSGSSIQGQRFAADGTPQGGEFQVNSYTTSNQGGYASVSVDADGDFVVVWHSSGSSGTDTSGYSVQGQRFTADGTPQGGEFQVNTYTTSGQYYPSVSVDADGDFVVVWHSLGSSGTDSSGRSVQGQRFQTPIFTDGFESGDTSAWSGTQ